MGACGGKSKPNKMVNPPPIEKQPQISQTESKKILGDQTTTSSISTNLQSNSYSQKISKEVSDNNEKKEVKEPVQQVEINIIQHRSEQKQKAAATDSTDMGSLIGMGKLVQNLPNHENNNNNNNANKIRMNPFQQQNEAPKLPHLFHNNNDQESQVLQNQIQAIESFNMSNMMNSDIKKDREQGLRYANQQGELTSECNVPGVPQITSKYI